MNRAYWKEHAEEALTLLRELCAIPAPLNGEARRAQFCMEKLRAFGVENVSIDTAGSVVCENWIQETDNVLIMAHLDTVFDENTDLTLREDGNRWCCPGIGDDTVNVLAVMMLMAKLARSGQKTRRGVIFALNTGEEGLGNLRGCRELMRRYAGRIGEVVSFDLYRGKVYTSCIGSMRYRIRVSCVGGHSFHDFGKPNAIAVLAGILTDLYRYVPQPGTDTTYNVGAIEGGSSVNVIARNAQCLWEFRSRDGKALEEADAFLRRTLKKFEDKGAQLELTLVGERPCRGDVSEEKMAVLAADCVAAVKEATGVVSAYESASTDCNVPLSMGIPAVCLGIVEGGGAHTLKEWIDADTVEAGMCAAENLLMKRAGLE